MKANYREKEIYKVTIVGGIGNLLLLIFKFIAGFLSHSAAMIADAVHSLSDFLTEVAGTETILTQMGILDSQRQVLTIQKAADLLG